MSTQTSQVIFPEVGDLVVATVKRVEDYGAYVKLDKFGGLYDPLEEAMDEGPEALIKAGLTEEWAQAIAEVSKTKIRLERSKVRGTVAVTCHKPGGLEIIRQSLLGAKKIRRPRGSEIKIYTIGAPKYRIEVEAGSFEAAEKTLNLVTEEILDSIKKAGGEDRKSVV